MCLILDSGCPLFCLYVLSYINLYYDKQLDKNQHTRGKYLCGLQFSIIIHDFWKWNRNSSSTSYHIWSQEEENRHIFACFLSATLFHSYTDLEFPPPGQEMASETEGYILLHQLIIIMNLTKITNKPTSPKWLLINTFISTDWWFCPDVF